MRSFILICLSLGLSLTLSAQAPGVTLSESFKAPEEYLPSDNILTLGDGFALYSLKYKKQPLKSKKKISQLETIKLLLHDQELKQTAVHDLSWNGTRDFRSLTSIEDNLLWVYETQKEKGAPISIKTQIVKPDGSLGKETKILTYSADDKIDYTIYRSRSFDKSKYIYVLTEASDNRAFSKKDDVNTSVTFFIVDNNGETITLEKKKLRVPRDRFEMLTIAVDNQGTAYMVGREFAKGSKKQKKNGSDALLKIYTLEAGSSDIVAKTLRTNAMYIRSATLVAGVDVTPSLFGTYAEEYGKGLNGFFFAKNPQDGKPLKPRPFTSTELDKLGKRVTRGKGAKRLIEPSFEFHGALVSRDGSASVLLESYVYSPSRVVTAGNGTTTNSPPRHSFGEGIIINLSPEGSIEDFTVVPKYQSMTYYISPWARMDLLGFNGKPAVIYNDNPKNLTRDLEKHPKALKWKNGVATIGYADENGNLVRRPLFSRKEADKMLIVPESATELKNGDVVFLSYRLSMFDRDQYMIGRLKRGTSVKARSRN
jgi:hypothetical protein